MQRASETHNYALEAGIVTMTLICACVLMAGTVATAKAQVSSRGKQPMFTAYMPAQQTS